MAEQGKQSRQGQKQERATPKNHLQGSSKVNERARKSPPVKNPPPKK